MFETAMLLELMEKLRDLCHQTSKDKGFWDEDKQVITRADKKKGGAWQEMTEAPMKPWNFGEKIALIHSELSEMFEAWRKGVGDHPTDKVIRIMDPNSTDRHTDENGMRYMTFIEEEVADVFIRLFDLCGKLDIDVGRVILAKMEYNKSRPHMHGGRRC